MPQLDLFTMQSQIICLIVSLFFIYNFLLKYAISSYDAFNRIKIKKLNFFKIQNIVLCYFSITLKKKTLEYSNFITENVFDFSKIFSKSFVYYFNFLYNNIRINKLTSKLFYMKLKKKNLKNIKHLTLRKILLKKTILNKIKICLISRLEDILLKSNELKFEKIIKYLIIRTEFEKKNLVKSFYQRFTLFSKIYLSVYADKLLKKLEKIKNKNQVRKINFEIQK